MKKTVMITLALLMIFAFSVSTLAMQVPMDGGRDGRDGVRYVAAYQRNNSDTVEIILDGTVEKEENPSTGAPIFAKNYPKAKVIYFAEGERNKEEHDTVEIVLDGIEEQVPDTGAPVVTDVIFGIGAVALALYLAGKNKKN